jgi:hypothetical protein
LVNIQIIWDYGGENSSIPPPSEKWITSIYVKTAVVFYSSLLRPKKVRFEDYIKC